MQHRIMRIEEVCRCTALARATIYKYIDQNLFPKSISLGGRAVGWLESEVQDWIQSRIDERDALRSTIT